jgi:cation transport protein ChaC
MLTRHAIDSGVYLKHFESMANLLPLEQIEASLEATMRLRPSDTDEVWVFGYGSLIWNPMVEFEQRRIATLRNWHRSFCLRMTAGRGNAECPGRMLALESGGTTLGLAMKLSSDTLYDELRRLWIREMVLGSYRPIWAVTLLDDGTERPSIAFVADTAIEQFQHDSSVETVAPLIGSASGKFGSNAEYLFLLRSALARYGLHDPYVDAIAARLEASSMNLSSLADNTD